MSKELEALNVLYKIALNTNIYYQEDCKDTDDYKERVNFHKNIIETALKEKEQYEAIEEEFGIHNNCDLIDNLRNIKLLEEVNAKNKKELKVLEIIKRDYYLVAECLDKYNSFEEMQKDLGEHCPFKTQEEFNTVKEVFGNE